MPLPAVRSVRRSTVAVVDDHELVGLAVRAALAGHRRLDFVGTASTVDLVLEPDPRPDLAVLDLRLGDGSAPEVNVARLRGAGIRVLVFTSGESPHLLRRVAKADVLGVVPKSDPVQRVVLALEDAAAGRPVAGAVWASALAGDPRLDEARLSAQEARVLSMFADGDRSGAVAEALGITVGTLEDYVRRIRTKYARIGRPATTKVDLYKRAVQDGFLPVPTRPGGT